MNINEIQGMIAQEKADAWIIFDYENKNPTVPQLLGQKMLTRRIVIVIPAIGRPYLLCHFIDYVFLNEESVTSSFDIRPYKTWQELDSLIEESAKQYKTVLMDISHNGHLPRASLADYGSVEFVKSFVKEIRSSANILQEINAKMPQKAYELQKNACEKTIRIKDEAFRKIRDDVRNKGASDEYEIQQFIANRFLEEGMVFDEAPIVAIGPNASNPHYGPTESTHSPIKEGDLVLIDMWAKENDPLGVYADITWMGYVGTEVPEVYAKRFAIVKAARDGAIAFLKEQLPLREVCGYEADDVARKIITDAGYGEYFKHRLGHNISYDVSPHGPGANLDNYETHDVRALISGTSFSDEPGIYAPDFGIRTETDLYNDNGALVIMAGLQEEIIPIMGIKD